MRLALLLILPLLAQEPIHHGKACPADCTPCGTSLRKALAYLQKELAAQPDASGTPFKPAHEALGALALLASGDTQYGKDVSRYEKSLEAYVKAASGSDVYQANWPVAFAGWLEAELAARGKKETKTRKAIVAYLESAQREDGGWGHSPKQTQYLDGYPRTLLVTTNVCATAVGLLAPESKSLVGAKRHYAKAQLKNGSFPYDVTQNAGGEAGRTSGAWWALHLAGDAAAEKRAAEFIVKHLEELPEGHASSALHVLSGAIACFVTGGDAWKKFNELFRDRILKAQLADGSFKCICSGNVFVCSESPLDSEMTRKIARVWITICYALVLELDRLQILKAPKGSKGTPTGPDTPTK